MNEPLSMPKDKIRVVLFENIHPSAVETLNRHGYSNVERFDKAFDVEAMKDKIRDAHMVGVRSRSPMSAEVIESAEKLMAIGCFSIGTDQVALDAAMARGIPVFNAPYSNTRSVAELVIAEVVMLMRRLTEKSAAAHEGRWQKSATGAFEVRGKTLGIVGYGHIGSQVSILAEAMGMRVLYYDIVDKLPMGNATPVANLATLLEESDVVTLHVPSTPDTRDMIGPAELARMKKGAYLINNARGNVVEIDALAEALRGGHIAGAAIDVFPKEPSGANEEFVSPLRGLNNVVLTPHIGGSTHEAQANIGGEVADKLVRYSDNGSTVGAVNFPEVALPRPTRGGTRFLHIHRNVPGILHSMNEILSDRNLNICGQYLRTGGEYGYVVVDVDSQIEPGQGVRKALEAIEGTLRVRFLY